MFREAYLVLIEVAGMGSTFRAQMSSAETGQMSAVETGQVSAAETGQTQGLRVLWKLLLAKQMPRMR